MLSVSCDFCKDELTPTDEYLNVPIGTDVPAVVRQLCKNCLEAIYNARGKR